MTLMEFCTVVLRTEKAISNPYSKAKALELISILIYTDRKKELPNIMTNNSEIIKEFFMETVTHFYVDIEFAGGQGDMFY